MMKRLMTRYRDREQGSLSVETVLILPMLIWAYAAMFVFWDAFLVKNQSVEASFTVADLVSRQEEKITNDFLEGLHAFYDVVVEGTSASDIRFTVVAMKPGDDPAVDDPVLEMEWSEGFGNMEDYTDVSEIKDLVPLLPIGATMVVVQTATYWEPPLNVGLSATRLDEIVFVSPRYVPEIRHEDWPPGV